MAPWTIIKVEPKSMNSTCARFVHVALIGLLSSYSTVASDKVSAAEPPAQPSDVATNASKEAEDAGAKLYGQFCAGCHGPNGEGGKSGEGMAKAPPSLVDDQWIYGSSDEAIFQVIKEGTPPEYAMVPWEGIISDEDIRKIVRYIKSLASK